MEFKRKSIFEDLDLLKEAEDDGDAEMSAATGDTGGGGDDAGDDEINIDADLNADDTNTGGDDTTPTTDDTGTDDGGDDMGDLDDLGGDNDGGDTSSTDTNSDEDSGDGEVNPANTDIFSSLSKEEQQVKIQQLKVLFGNMYSSCIDIGEKIDNIDYDIANHETVSRLAAALYRLKDYISDYITKVFPYKDYYQNNVEYWKFLSNLNSITNVAQELNKIKEKDQKDDKK